MQYLSVLKKMGLFAGMEPDEIAAALHCLHAESRLFHKGEYIFHEGETITCIAVLADGKLLIQRNDYWGNQSLLYLLETGELFGGAYIAPGGGALLHDIVAAEDSIVIFFHIQKILTRCPSDCKYQIKLIQNLFFTLSEKNRKLAQKLNYMAQRTIRDKLLSYLSDQSMEKGTSSFDIPFNRQQLADFLSVDRSALSKELCKMRDDGLLRFHKNHFELIKIV